MVHLGPYLTHGLAFSLMDRNFCRLHHTWTLMCLLGNLPVQLSRRNLVSGLTRVGTLAWQFRNLSVTQLLCEVFGG